MSNNVRPFKYIYSESFTPKIKNKLIHKIHGMNATYLYSCYLQYFSIKSHVYSVTLVEMFTDCSRQYQMKQFFLIAHLCNALQFSVSFISITFLKITSLEQYSKHSFRFSSPITIINKQRNNSKAHTVKTSKINMTPNLR